MRFHDTGLWGAYIIELEPVIDNRGFFARTYCANEFESHHLMTGFVQCNISYNDRRGTLRGLHFQTPPFAEAKLVRCTRGSIFDVIVDLRAGSTTFGRYYATELSCENRLSLYVPVGFAHGFQTLEDRAEIFYQMTNFYSAGNARGLRYDDPGVGIRWPLDITAISEKDLTWPVLKDYQNPFEGNL